MQDVSVSADVLLKNDRLTFPLPVEEHTGAILDRKRYATDRGLTFTLVPRLTGKNSISRYRVELNGSIHRYSRNGLHNADDFTASDLLPALNELITTYTINPFLTRLNNVEFGVNIRLSFPVSRVLSNLVSYKYRPFTKEPGNGFDYYQCQTQRYIVKLYNKGQQYELEENVLRVEVKVLKMAYLKEHAVNLNTLADLLNVANYGTLGALLVEVFTEILFDEPTIKIAALTTKEKEVYQNGRNARFWAIPDELTNKEYSRKQKSLKRAEIKFRALVSKYRVGEDWQSLTAALIGQTWQRISTVDNDLQTRINEQLTAWHSYFTGLENPEKNREPSQELPEKCPKLTGVSETNVERGTVEKCPKLTGFVESTQNGKMSEINPLSIGLISDNGSSQQTGSNLNRETLPQTPENSRVTSCKPQPIKLPTRPTATQLRANPELLVEVEKGRKQYAKGSKENRFKRAAHNRRNDDSNPRNNLARRVRRIVEVKNGQPLPLFAPVEVVRLQPDQQAALDYWKGTRHEIRL